MKYYITRTVGNITLYYDGENFQPEQKHGQHYEDHDEAKIAIESNDLQFAEVTPVSFGEVYQQLQSFSKPHRA